MEWDRDNLSRLHRIFSDRSWQIAAPIVNSSHPAAEQLAWQAWSDYVFSIGLKMELSCNDDTGIGSRPILNGDGSTTIRLINTWGDRYIEVPEDFAVRALALGFLP